MEPAVRGARSQSGIAARIWDEDGVLKTEPSGTEVWDPETGRQKSPLRRLETCRDQNLGNERSQIPAESARKSAIWKMPGSRGLDGGRTRARTWDPLIKSQLLYQLSYAPATGPESLRKRASFSKVTPRCPANRLGISARSAPPKTMKKPPESGGFPLSFSIRQKRAFVRASPRSRRHPCRRRGQSRGPDRRLRRRGAASRRGPTGARDASA